MDNDFPLAASYDSTYLRSFECSCQLYKSSLQRRNHLISHPYSFSLLKSHRYPEQHDKNNNALFTGQYIVTVQLSLSVDLWICLLVSIWLRLIYEANKSEKSALSWKQSITTVPINCSPIRISLADL